MKRPSKISGIRGLFGVLLIVGVAAAGVGGFYLGERRGGNDLVDSGSVSVRRTITITETDEGDILFDGKPLTELAKPLNIPRPFFDSIPSECPDVLEVLREIMAKHDTARDLPNEKRGTFELMHYLARDLCSYESYRGFLTTDLFAFLYSVGEPAAGSMAVGGVVVEANPTDTTATVEDDK